MSRLVYDHDPGSGLLVARQGAEEASVRRALKDFDDRLMLDYAIDEEWGRLVWQVLCRTGSTTPPHVVCRWRADEGDPTSEPLPLSHGLVERVKRLHVTSRAPRVDVDALNDQHIEQVRGEADAELEEYAAELVDRLKGKSGALLPRGTYRRRTIGRDITGIR